MKREPEESLSMAGALLHLANLDAYFPAHAAPKLLAEFGRRLAKKLNKEVVPLGFLMACELALVELQQANPFGYPPAIYYLLRLDFPRIALAVVPVHVDATFAAEVKAHFDAIMAQVK